MFLSTFITKRRKPLTMLTLCLIAVGLPLLVAAQDSPADHQPVISAELKEIQQCGYTLSPQSVTFQSGPVMNFSFSIYRKDNMKFGALKQESIEAFQEGDKVAISPGGLQNQTKTPVSAMLLIDVSLSMRDKTFRKLDAVKAALHGFIDSATEWSEREERIGIAKFDLSPVWVTEPKSDKQALHQAVDKLGGKDRSWLYNAIKWSLAKAKANGIENLIVLSDGVDSTMQLPRNEVMRQTNEERIAYQKKLLEFEQKNEPEIIKEAQTKNIPIYVIEMGNTDEKDEAIYVYRTSLGNISRQTSGWDDYYIALRDLLKPEQDYDNSLRNSLSDVLEKIREAYKHDYSLPLSLAGCVQPDGEQHTIVINFRFDRCVLQATIDYAWKPGEIAPVVIKTGIAFIALDPNKHLSEITRIYLIMIAVLGLMSAGPLLGRQLLEERGMRQLRRAIIKVRRGSPYLGQECPSEGSFRRFQVGDWLLRCPSCKQAHHLDCWQQARGRCYVRNCSSSNNPRPLTKALAERYKLSADL
ncbi:MAG TPA: VWA domain-containing protein [Blastocatellia bacterium]|nr:VWA domain-containing protein [Blastocatellia bacterium]